MRCPRNRKVGAALSGLSMDHFLARGYANVVESKEEEVEGVLFELTPSDEDSLTGGKGWLWVLSKADLRVLQGDLEVVALVYVDPITAEGPPREEYVQRIREGLADAKLSEGYVARYVRKFIPA